ncbi:MAG: hypothetical protein KYX62_06285 [Pseudomonadota bacterium]|nr:hypothetical protein [Pseudomonadota bacterium]
MHPDYSVYAPALAGLPLLCRALLTFFMPTVNNGLRAN